MLYGRVGIDALFYHSLLVNFHSFYASSAIFLVCSRETFRDWDSRRPHSQLKLETISCEDERLKQTIGDYHLRGKRSGSLMMISSSIHLLR